MKTEKNPKGSGRKPLPENQKKRTFSVICYPEQIEQIRNYAKNLKRE